MSSSKLKDKTTKDLNSKSSMMKEKKSKKSERKVSRQSNNHSPIKKSSLKTKNKNSSIDESDSSQSQIEASLENSSTNPHQKTYEEVDDFYSKIGEDTLSSLRKIAGEDKIQQVVDFLKDKNDVLRWQYKMEDPVLEQIRIELYKINRRKRYIADAQKRGSSWGAEPPPLLNDDENKRRPLKSSHGPYATKEEMGNCYTLQEMIDSGLIDPKSKNIGGFTLKTLVK